MNTPYSVLGSTNGRKWSVSKWLSFNGRSVCLTRPARNTNSGPGSRLDVSGVELQTKSCKKEKEEAMY